jgi:iron-sulfur cluster insertion protein
MFEQFGEMNMMGIKDFFSNKFKKTKATAKESIAESAVKSFDPNNTATVETEQHNNTAPELIFTDNAANKVKELLAEENNPSLKLRAFISGGGCSGFQYGFTFDEEQNEDDFIFEKNGVTLLVDVMSMQYLKHAEIDYKEDETGEQFVIRNPNAQTTCGCGSSFSA